MLDPGDDEYTNSEAQKDLESRNQNLVSSITSNGFYCNDVDRINLFVQLEG